MFVWAFDCVTKLRSDVVACCRTSLLAQPNSERRHNEGISPKPGRADSGHFLPARDFPWATLISSGSRRLWPWATCSTQFVNDVSTLYLFCGFFHNFVCLSSLKSSGWSILHRCNIRLHLTIGYCVAPTIEILRSTYHRPGCEIPDIPLDGNFIWINSFRETGSMSSVLK